MEGVQERIKVKGDFRAWALNNQKDKIGTNSRRAEVGAVLEVDVVGRSGIHLGICYQGPS